jgi:hypothetical protein
MTTHAWELYLSQIEECRRKRQRLLRDMLTVTFALAKAFCFGAGAMLVYCLFVSFICVITP